MEFVTSRNLVLPDTADGLTGGHWFNLWPKKLWPYDELELGDTVYWYHSPSKCIVWRSRVVDVSRFPYSQKEQVKANLHLTDPQAAERYFVEAPEPGFCLAYRVEAVERMSLSKPEEFRFPQKGWLRITDDIVQKWPGLGPDRRSPFPKYRDIELPLLRELSRRGGSAEPTDQDGHGRTVYASLADMFGLSKAQREERTDDGEGRVFWERMVRWARQKLLDKGFLASNQRGIWELTPEGRKFADAAQIDVEDEELTDDEIDQALRDNRLRIGIVPTDSQQAIVRKRKGQARIRRLTIRHYRARCAVCDVTDRALLIASHIVRWADAPEHRGDLSNVICLCRMHDALFEAGYFSLSDDCELVKKASVASMTIRQLLDGMDSFRFPHEYPPAPRFLCRHRERAGFGAQGR